MDVEELTGKIADEWERYQRADAERIEAALNAGAALIELRERLPHGDFLPAIRRLGIADRTAQNWMRLSRAGMKYETVAHLGGIRAALEHLRQRATTANDARRFDLESENAGVRRQLADAMVDAGADTLEMLARLVRLQVEVQEARNRMNEFITENEALKQERKSLRASIAIQSPWGRK